MDINKLSDQGLCVWLKRAGLAADVVSLGEGTTGVRVTLGKRHVLITSGDTEDQVFVGLYRPGKDKPTSLSISATLEMLLMTIKGWGSDGKGIDQHYLDALVLIHTHGGHEDTVDEDCSACMEEGRPDGAEWSQ